MDARRHPLVIGDEAFMQCQWGSFFDHQDGWRIANKQRRTSLCHAVRGQRQSRRNLSSHPQRTPTRQPRINKNQEGLMGEEHATVWMVQRKAYYNERSYSTDYEFSPTGKSDNPPSCMFVTNYFNKKKENIRFIQPSILQHRITFVGEFYHPNLILQNSSVGEWSSLNHLMPCC